jgi:hypothetical protein
MHTTEVIELTLVAKRQPKGCLFYMTNKQFKIKMRMINIHR